MRTNPRRRVGSFRSRVHVPINPNDGWMITIYVGTTSKADPIWPLGGKVQQAKYDKSTCEHTLCQIVFEFNPRWKVLPQTFKRWLVLSQRECPMQLSRNHRSRTRHVGYGLGLAITCSMNSASDVKTRKPTSFGSLNFPFCAGVRLGTIKSSDSRFRFKTFSIVDGATVPQLECTVKAFSRRTMS